MQNVTLKQLKPIFKSVVSKNQRPILNNAMVVNNKILLTDIETHLYIKDTYQLKEGLHTLDTIDLLTENNGVDTIDFPLLAENIDIQDRAHLINIKLLEHSIKFASKDETRLYLNGLCVCKDNLVATNGHVLIFNEIDYQGNESYIIPTKSIKVLIRLMKKYKFENVTMGFGEGFMIVDNSQFKLIVRTIKREYPKYQAVIPAKFKYQFNVTNWINFKELKPLFNSKTFKCFVTVIAGIVSLTIDGHDGLYIIGHCEDKKLDLRLGFNASYLDLVCNGHDRTVLKGNNEMSPMLTNRNELIMPMKL